MPKKRADCEISEAELRLTICGLALRMFGGLRGGSRVANVADRLIYYACIIGTIQGRPPSVTKIANDVGMSRAAVRTHLADLIHKGVLVDGNGKYSVNPAFANDGNVLERLHGTARMIEKAASQIEVDRERRKPPP